MVATLTPAGLMAMAAMMTFAVEAEAVLNLKVTVLALKIIFRR